MLLTDIGFKWHKTDTTSTKLLLLESLSLQPSALPTSGIRGSPLSAFYFFGDKWAKRSAEREKVKREVAGPPLSPPHACLMWCSLRNECRGRHNGHVSFPSVERPVPLNHKWHPASPGTIWESEPAQEEQNVPSIHQSIRPLLPPALKTSHHRKQLPSLLLIYFFTADEILTESVSALRCWGRGRENRSNREEKR